MQTLQKLLMAMLIILIGTAIVSPINTSTAAITTPTYSVGAASLFGLMTLFFAVMMIMYIFKGMSDI